jgi:hypothetical protein
VILPSAAVGISYPGCVSPIFQNPSNSSSILSERRRLLGIESEDENASRELTADQEAIDDCVRYLRLIKSGFKNCLYPKLAEKIANTCTSFPVYDPNYRKAEIAQECCNEAYYSSWPQPPCFHGSSSISLESGEEKAIADIEIGDKVLVYSDAKKEFMFSPVIFIFIPETMKIRNLTSSSSPRVSSSR